MRGAEVDIYSKHIAWCTCVRLLTSERGRCTYVDVTHMWNIHQPHTLYSIKEEMSSSKSTCTGRAQLIDSGAEGQEVARYTLVACLSGHEEGNDIVAQVSMAGIPLVGASATSLVVNIGGSATLESVDDTFSGHCRKHLHKIVVG